MSEKFYFEYLITGDGDVFYITIRNESGQKYKCRFNRDGSISLCYGCTDNIPDSAIEFMRNELDEYLSDE